MLVGLDTCFTKVCYQTIQVLHNYLNSSNLPDVVDEDIVRSLMSIKCTNDRPKHSVALVSKLFYEACVVMIEN